METPLYRSDRLEHPTPWASFKWESDTVKTVLRRKAASMDPPLVLVTASTSLYVVLKNRMTLPRKPGRLVPVLLRADPNGPRRWVDNIKVQYRSDDDVPAVGFAKCLGFFGDAAHNNHVAIQWYKICGRRSIGRISRMCKVELMESYQYIPVGSILNGALIVPLDTAPPPGYPQQSWAILSQRECSALERLNG